jgi:hypothetical protein
MPALPVLVKGRSDVETLTIVNPIAIPRQSTETADTFALAARPASMDGLRVGLYWNGKNHGDLALGHTRRRLGELYPAATFVEFLGEKGGLNRYASPGQLEQIAADCDVMVGTTADCGSCTSWLLRDMANVERGGIPTVALVATGFVQDARWSAEVFGCKELAIAEMDRPFTNQDDESIGQMVAAAIGTIIQALTTQGSTEAAYVPAQLEPLDLPSDPLMTFTGADQMVCFDTMNRAFIAEGWSDGLPLVPPTPDKVAAMVAASGRPADDVVGEFAPGFGIGTVEKIAANAVMAGAPPDAMPVILAMAECVLEPSIGLRTFAMSTGPQAPVVLVSGPIATQIGMNSGVCALGPGSLSWVNVAIGRTLRLMMMNVGHSYPGTSDMDTIGTPMKFSACVAENEARNPWAPFRVQEGFDASESTVTVNVPYGMCELFDFENTTPEGLIESFSTVTRNVVGSPNPGIWLIKEPADPSAGYPFNGVFHNLILMCPEHAEVFARAGWTTEQIKKALHASSTVSFAEAMVNKPLPLFRSAHPDLLHLLDKPQTPVELYPSPDCFQIFVVGAVAGRSLYMHGGTVSVTKAVRA